MRTERIFLFGTHFFCVLERVCFLHTWALGKMLCLGEFPLYTLSLHHQKNNNGVPEANINPQGSGNKL